MKPFPWKLSATCHGKDVVDNVGGHMKASVHAKVMSLGRDQVIVQDAKSFCQLALSSCDKTTVIHVTKEEVYVYHSKDNEGIGEVYNKIPVVTKNDHVGEVMESIQETFTIVKGHQNTKRIQATEFQTHINHPNKRV